MTLVLDASLTLSWCFEDEITDRTEALLDRVRTEGALVSAIWNLEVANGLLWGPRRGKTTPAKAAAFAQALESLPIEVDGLSLVMPVSWALGLAMQYGLTPYDSTYVELALRRQLPLACNDEPMQTAGRAIGLEVL